MKEYFLTIFTPTYNRAYILPQLKNSLLRQDVFSFEWLIIDDGSTDNTQELVKNWLNEDLPFDIQYHKVENGGKCRAFNLAYKWAQSEWLFILDSDDYLADNSIGYIKKGIQSISGDGSFVGVGVLRGHSDDRPLGKPTFTGEYVDCTDLDRPVYGLNFDCNEAYRISTFRKFPFVVWPGEKFTPEEVVLKEMSLHGYKLRWYNKVMVISEYLQDGMTRGSWNLMKENPMGYAMLYNHKLKYQKGIKIRINIACQFLANCLLSGNISYIRECNDKLLSIICLPLGAGLAVRRWLQFRKL